MERNNEHPSPASYSLPSTVGFKDHDIRKKRSPAYSFGLRTSTAKTIQSPGPNAYNIPSTIGGKDVTKKRSAAFTIRSRLQTKKTGDTPAPNAYALQNFKPGKRPPAYSMGIRL